MQAIVAVLSYLGVVQGLCREEGRNVHGIGASARLDKITTARLTHVLRSLHCIHQSIQAGVLSPFDLMHIYAPCEMLHTGIADTGNENSLNL
jgi:hypothetical protein